MGFIEKQLIPVPFTGGIDTKTDPHQVLAGNLLSLQNGQFSKAGQINKRYGYDLLSNNIEGGGQISSAAAIQAFNDELTLFDGTSIYSHVDATGNWLNRGTAISVIATDKKVLRLANDEQLNPDVAYLNGVELYAWEDSRGGVRYSVVDSATKAFCVSDASLNSSAFQPKCIAFNGQIYIFYTDGVNNIFYQSVNPLNPTLVSGQQLATTDGYTNNFTYDVATIGSQIFLAFISHQTASGELDLFSYDTSMTRSSYTVVETGVGKVANTGLDNAVNIVGDSSNNLWISWASGTHVRTAYYSYTKVSILSDMIVEAIRSVALTGIESSTANTLQLTYEVYASSASNERIKTCTITPAGTVSTKQTLRSVGLASKAFKADDNIYVNVAFDSTLQSTYFTVLISDTMLPIIAKISSQVGGGLRTNGMLSEVPTVGTNIFLWANEIAGKTISEANTTFSLLGVNSTTLDFENSNQFLASVQSNNLLFTGGIVQGYDGVSAVELGFHVYPEDLLATPAGTDGYLSTGAYQYCATFEWTDNLGQIQRSAPSVPITVNATATNHVTLTIPTLRLTSKQGSRAAPSIVIYRTQVDEVDFYRVTSTLAPLINDTTVDSVQFVDILSDDSIAANELVYTTGNILANIAPPACKLITTYQNRVIIGGLEDPNQLWFSKNKFDNSQFNTIPIEFAAELTIGVDPRGGPITALGLLNSNLIIFKETTIFVLSGDGPNDTGGGTAFDDPVLIASDVGCVDPNSVVITPMGIMFKSAKGIYLLDGSLKPQYIGSKVEDYNSYSISSATLIPYANQVVFTTANGPALVYDYFFGQWSTWTNHESVDSDVFGGVLVIVKANGKVYQQNVTSFTDAGSPILMSFETPNLNFAQAQGFMSVFRAFILGTYRGPHKLNVSVAYDFNSAYSETGVIDSTTNIQSWGSDDHWGDSSVWGGVYNIYEFRVDFARHKCTSIRLKISDAQTSNYNEGYSISGLTFEVGLRPGGNRLPASSTIGTT